MESNRAERAVQWLGDAIDARPGTVVVIFLLVTVAMVGGLGAVSQSQAGAGQFTEEFPEAEAQEQMNSDFESSAFDTGGGNLQVLVQGDNVLSERGLVAQLRAQKRLEARDNLRMTETSSPAETVARELDPGATDYNTQIAVIEDATNAELRDAIDAAAPAVEPQVGKAFNPTAATATVAMLTASHSAPSESGTGNAVEIEEDALETVEGVDGYEIGTNVYAFGSGTTQSEFNALLGDTVTLVTIVSVLLILGFLAVAYRDPVDLVVGLLAIVMTLVWTLGFMGYVGIPFGEFIFPIFPLLLAVGIDFGIHVVNRYREERADGAGMGTAMQVSTAQLAVVFLIVGLTSSVSLLANLAATLEQIQDFGVVATAGMLFTLPIFGVFVPAAKLKTDRLRAGTRFPEFGSTPFGNEGTSGRVLSVGVSAARVAPIAVLVVALVGAGAMGAAGSDIHGEFGQDTFFPDEDRLETLQKLPGPLSPSEYLFVGATTILEEKFDDGSAVGGSSVVYIQAPMEEPESLAAVGRATRQAPPGIGSEARGADAQSIVGVIDDYAEEDEAFARMVESRDRTGDGIPNEDLGPVYDELLASPHGDRAANYLASDRRSTRIVYTIEPDASDEVVTDSTRSIADSLRVDATETGGVVVNQAITEEVVRSAFRTLAVGLGLTLVVLLVGYAAFERRPWLGVVTLLPVGLSVGLLAGTMQLLDIPLTPFNAPVFTVAVGLGADYAAHFTHRFSDEYDGGSRAALYAALETTARGTGGALTGSMLTTTLGVGAMYLAVISLISSFGVVIALGVLYAYLGSLLVLPSAIVVSHRMGVL